MTLQTPDLNLEWQAVRQNFLRSIYSLNLSFKSNKNEKSTKKKDIEKLANSQCFINQLIELNNKLNCQTNWLFEKAKLHDHTGQQANGYFSIIRILLALSRLISKKVLKLSNTNSLKSSKRTEMIDFLNVGYYFVYLIDNMITIFDYNLNGNQPLNNDPKNLFCLSIENFSTMNLLSMHEDAQRALSLICSSTGIFWYSKSVRNYFKALRLLFIGFTSNPFRFLHCLISPKECGRILARKCTNSTVEYVTRSLSALEMGIYNKAYFSLINLNKAFHYTAKTVHVKVATSFKVPLNNDLKNQDNQHIQLVNEHNHRKVRCRLISGFTEHLVKKHCSRHNLSPKKIDSKKDINPNRIVIFHVHGGGFCATSPDSHEIYLRKWATKLNDGIPILSVDYQLRSAYPIAIQECLDVYLKLFTINNRNTKQENNQKDKKVSEENQAEKLFGFIPENIILVGDSCGGNLILSLLCCLNDIKRQKLNKINFIMPFALTAIYPVFDLRAVCSPSKFIGCLDMILSNPNLLAMHGCYGGLNSQNALNCNSIVNRIKNRHVKPWFLCTDEQCTNYDNLDKNKTFSKNCSKKHIENRFIRMNEHLDGPFASPATYKHFEDFQSITMNLISTHICPLLDDTVEMYRKWPGNKTIKFFDNLPHGFIQFIDMSQSSKKACNQIVQIINSTIEDHSAKLSANKIDENNNQEIKINEGKSLNETNKIKDGEIVNERL